MCKYKLYGDGIHDDTLAIQEMIDGGRCEVCLPVPEKYYLISKPLELPSNFRLTLPRYAEIRLAKNSNCLMLKNKTPCDPVKLMPQGVEDIPCQNIEISGGIWNCNNKEQRENPLWTQDFSIPGFFGMGMFFYNIKNFKISNLTLKDPLNFGITLDTITYFTVEDITFDYNRGNPALINMDGVHINGNCHFGYIRNLKGTCYDDLVALNADEGSGGDITNIEIDGIFSQDCHSAVRLLCVHKKVEKIHISNVYGTYYQYCIGVTRFCEEEATGVYDSLSFDHIFASKAVRPDDYPWPDHYVYPLIWVEKGLYVKNLSVKSLFRREYNNPIDTFHIGKDTLVENLILEDISTENHTSQEMTFFENNGTVKHLKLSEIRCDEPKLLNNGVIEDIVKA